MVIGAVVVWMVESISAAADLSTSPSVSAIANGATMKSILAASRVGRSMVASASNWLFKFVSVYVMMETPEPV